MMEVTMEEYKPIPRYYEYYKVSKKGTVVNKNGMPLKCIVDSDGNVMVELRYKGKRERIPVIDIVMDTWGDTNEVAECYLRATSV